MNNDIITLIKMILKLESQNNKNNKIKRKLKKELEEILTYDR